MPTSPDTTESNICKAPGEWQVYILRCSDQTLYTGITNNLARRLREHNGDIGKGARYTRPRRPVNVVYVERSKNRQTASQREAALKTLTRAQKEHLIAAAKAHSD